MTTGLPYLLLIDDDPDDHYFFTAAFTKALPNVGIKHFANAYEALQMLKSCPTDALPTVLLIDYQMPGLDGPGLLQALQTNPVFKDILKLVWSTSRRIKDMEECKKYGAVHYFVKPSTNAELDKIVQQIKALFPI